MTDELVESTDKRQAKAKTHKKTPGVVSIDPERCKGCGFCVEFCPLDVLAMAAKFNSKGYHYPELRNPEKCTGCGLCGMYCPDFAIFGARVNGVGGAPTPANGATKE